MSSWSVLLAACALAPAAQADLPNTAPIYGGGSVAVAVALPEHSVPSNDELRDEAERRLRWNGDVESVAVGSLSASLGATLLVGGIAAASSSNWQAADCASCLPTVLFLMGGVQLSTLAVFLFTAYGGPHQGRHHARRVDALVRAMSHPSIEAAKAARRGRLTLAWSFLASGAVLVASSVALFAIGHQDGFDDGLRMGIAGLNGLVGSWLTNLGGAELATKWTAELAITPVPAGAMVGYARRW